jgi:hypothetical protein
MSALSFFVDFAVNGHIEDVGLNSTPEEWAESLGTDFVDDKSKSNKRLRRDYGLVELGFFRAGGLWSCFLISLQAHRLWRDDGNVPQKLIDRYGEFPRSVQFEQFRRALSMLGYEPQPIVDDQGSHTARYYMPFTKALIAVVSNEVQKFDCMPVGSVWAMHLSENSNIWSRPPKGHRNQGA